ncbi:unnamed protein product [Discula destructiva]
MPYSIVVGKPSLGKAPENANVKPHHKSTRGFQNPHASANKDFNPKAIPFKIIKGYLDGTVRNPVPKAGEKLCPVREPTFLTTRFASKELRTTWLGHASHYTEFPSGLRVLFDPVLEDRCSPFSFAGPKRFTKRACAIADLPFVDAVVISHSHYDHLSTTTIKELKTRFPDAHFFVGLGLASWFRDTGITNVTEMDWWEDAEVSVSVQLDGESATTAAGEDKADEKTITATISCLPSQHTSSRSGLDADRTLWCSWAVSSSPITKSLYFGGDTGYRSVPQVSAGEDDRDAKYAHLPSNPDFKLIGSLRGPFDLGLLPIGAYQPRAWFSWMHADPFDAVDIFRDTRCARALGIHWGTWALTSEPIMEPPEKLREALGRAGIAETGVFDVCDIGESRTF